MHNVHYAWLNFYNFLNDKFISKNKNVTNNISG